MKNSVEFVRQGTFIALGMILVEQSEASSSALSPTRAKYSKVISNKHEDPMARFVAAIDRGFIDAGGRNVTITLRNRVGSINTSAVVRMALFYHFRSERVNGDAVGMDGAVGVGCKLRSKAAAGGRRQYLSMQSPVPSPTPSTTKAVAEGESMDLGTKQEGKVDVKMKSDEASPKDGDVSPVYLSVLNIADTDQASTSKPKKTEPASELHPNFSRVTPAQLPYISFSSNGRCQPMRAVSAKVLLSSKNVKAAVRDTSVALGSGSEKYAGGGGILNLTDLRPNEEPEYIERQMVPAPAAPEAAPTANADVRSQPPTYRSPYCSG
ncbi:hypothetical protein CPB84DRAFT_1853839 [Gymnopilus junonius]|uniref:26S proteasome regulatory subunit RPN2 C-terminal domain-containing protein n=1 Tax=Gymnopilus junonius TaxID=109634 RepID=A0A9P5TH06_GYMJU|nr:hypothetical protein CPB84DRAFT_1853839 [Gymnopilus junonius]